MVRCINIVVAATETHYGIGWRQTIPWKLTKDLKHFRDLTVRKVNQDSIQHAVIMGRKTYESLPDKYRPLPNRYNHILTRNRCYREQHNIPEIVGISSTLTDAIREIETYEVKIDKIFIIGGQQVYEDALKYIGCTTIYLTLVKASIPCDTFFESDLKQRGFQITTQSEDMEENGIRYQFLRLERSIKAPEIKEPGILPASDPMHEEQQYLALIRNVIENGMEKQDRTGMRYSLRNRNFPLLTTKRVFWRGVVEELLWFIRGETNAKILQDKGIHIWDGNASAEYLQRFAILFIDNSWLRFSIDSIGLHDRQAGDLGPIYGFQWRHFGAKYIDMNSNYTGQGFDQLADVIKRLQSNPNDRRIVLSAWNPNDLNQMALPPCHVMCQFYAAKGALSCQMYQRSADVGLGVPFNIASYALLTCMIAHIVGLEPGEFIHVIGDAHVYLNHVEPLKLQLQRKPRSFPTLTICPTRKVNCIEELCFDDFELRAYDPHPAIKMKMAV